jgi:hypothetical protein
VLEKLIAPELMLVEIVSSCRFPDIAVLPYALAGWWMKEISLPSAQ